MYILFTIGVIFLAISLRKFTKSSKKLSSNVKWLGENDGMSSMERKLSAYVPESRRRMSDKEMDMYFTSLVTPLNQALDSFETIQIAIHEENDDDEDD